MVYPDEDSGARIFFFLGRLQDKSQNQKEKEGSQKKEEQQEKSRVGQQESAGRCGLWWRTVEEDFEAGRLPSPPRPSPSPSRASSADASEDVWTCFVVLSGSRTPSSLVRKPPPLCRALTERNAKKRKP